MGCSRHGLLVVTAVLLASAGEETLSEKGGGK